VTEIDAIGQLGEPDVESPPDGRRARKEHLHRLAHAGLDAGRSHHDERARAPRELAVEDQERDAAEVIAVQVGEDHRVDRRGIDAEAAHRNQGRRAAVDEGLGRARLEMDARLEAPAAAERVARAEEAYLHEDLISGLMISCRP
jgi:hypothetical protein